MLAGGVFSAFVTAFVCVSCEVKIKSPNMEMLSYGTYGWNFYLDHQLVLVFIFCESGIADWTRWFLFTPENAILKADKMFHFKMYLDVDR